MIAKDIDLGKVLFIRKRLTIPEIGRESMECCGRIHALAEQQGLDIVGPWNFISYDLPKDIDTEFFIEYCLPVSGDCDVIADDLVQAKTLSTFNCMSHTYEGALTGLFEEGYQPLLQHITAKGYAFTGESREVYHTWSAPESMENVVEIQFGVSLS